MNHKEELEHTRTQFDVAEKRIVVLISELDNNTKVSDNETCQIKVWNWIVNGLNNNSELQLLWRIIVFSEVLE